MAQDSRFGEGRSTAILLFTDQVGSTELRSRVGEAAAEELRRSHDRLVAEAIEAHRGRLIKNLGDGVMAMFSGASDAVAAAVRIQQSVDRHNRSGATSAPLEIRIGLSAGDVTMEGGDCFGTPVIEAARLCAAAQGGQILVTEIVRLLAGSGSPHQTTAVGTLDLKGLATPVSACAVAWQPLPEPSIPMPAMLTSPGRIFVGREEELERLWRLWKEAVAGERRLALLGGEPGIGKTRLAVELARTVREPGGIVLAGRCDEDLGVPYQPFVEALRHYVMCAEERRLGRHAGELTRLLPELAQFVGDLPEPLRSDPETERYRLFDAVASWLGEVSRDTPVLLVIDDLQWATKPTVLLLRHVLRSPEPLRLLVVATYRDTDVGRGHPLAEFLADLPRFEVAERLSLSGLSLPGVAAFLEQAAGHELDDDGAELARAVWVETEGNAFFVTEVLRHLAESGAIARHDGRWVVTGAIDGLAVPQGVRDVVGRRLSRLSEEANRVLACAAVVGLEFDPVIVATAAGIGEDAVLSALDEALGARLVIEAPGTTPRSRFSHALVRATLYEELSAARRMSLHRRVAEALEAIHGEYLEDHLPGLAHHWARAAAPAAETGRAVEYARRAGDRALAQFANDEAANYYREALDLLDAAGVGPDDPRRLDLLISLGEAQRRVGDPGHRATLLAAADLAKRRGDAEALARAALANTRGTIYTVSGAVDRERVAALEAALAASTGVDDSTVRARLLSTLALELTFSDDADRRLSLSDEALATARRLGDTSTLAHVLIARNAATLRPDRIRERLADTAELVDAASSVRDPALRARALIVGYRTLVLIGRIEEARRLLQAADDLANELGQPALRWMTSYMQGAVALIAGDLARAERLTRSAAELGAIAGYPDAAWGFAFHLFLIRSEQGRTDQELGTLLDAAAADMDAAGARLHAVEAAGGLAAADLGRVDAARAVYDRLVTSPPPFDLYWVIATAMWAQLAVRLGEVGRAGALYEALRPYTEYVVLHPAFPTPSVSFYLGTLAGFLGRFDHAHAQFAAAVADHERIGAPTFLARTRLEWAEMLLTRGEPGDLEQARELLGLALGAAREFGLAGVERRAADLLASE